MEESPAIESFLTWSRPPAPAVPAVWGRHEHGGRSYRVQDATPDQHDAILRLYREEYMRDEPACRNLGVADDEVSAAEYSMLIAGALGQGACLVALEDAGDAGLGADPEIVGGMILPVLSAADPELPEMQGAAMRVLMSLSNGLRSKPDCDPLRRHDLPVTHYACDLGLWTRRDRRGRGIGEAVLRAVPALCRGLGVPHFSTLFTGAGSQRLATKVGFQELASVDYADVMDEAGRPAFRGMPEQRCKLMGIDVDVSASR